MLPDRDVGRAATDIHHDRIATRGSPAVRTKMPGGTYALGFLHDGQGHVSRQEVIQVSVDTSYKLQIMVAGIGTWIRNIPTDGVRFRHVDTACRCLRENQKRDMAQESA